MRILGSILAVAVGIAARVASTASSGHAENVVGDSQPLRHLVDAARTRLRGVALDPTLPLHHFVSDLVPNDLPNSEVKTSPFPESNLDESSPELEDNILLGAEEVPPPSATNTGFDFGDARLPPSPAHDIPSAKVSPSSDGASLIQLLKGASPAPDVSQAGSRMGALHGVAAPSDWGSQPYPLGYSGTGPFTSDLPRSYGQLLTDDSDDAYRIRKQLLDAHNYVRQLEAPEATYMTKMNYDFHLEAYATQWAEYLCTAPRQKFFEHSPTVNGFPAWPWRVSPGENLYTTTGLRNSKYDFSEVVHKWYAEKEYYNWSTGKAQPTNRGPVGHYKQLVRQETTAVGCAVITGCKSDGDWRTFVACQYDHGNVGKDPYVRRNAAHKGRVCDACPKGFDCCEKNLCAGHFVSQNIEALQPAKTFTDKWYGCRNSRRIGCAGTGALTQQPSIPGDNYQLEYMMCHCGAGAGHRNLYDTVGRGFLWYRDRCFKVVTAGQRRLRGEENLFLDDDGEDENGDFTFGRPEEVNFEQLPWVPLSREDEANRCEIEAIFVDDDETTVHHTSTTYVVSREPTEDASECMGSILPPPSIGWRYKPVVEEDQEGGTAASATSAPAEQQEEVSEAQLPPYAAFESDMEGNDSGEDNSPIFGAFAETEIEPPPSETDIESAESVAHLVEKLRAEGDGHQTGAELPELAEGEIAEIVKESIPPAADVADAPQLEKEEHVEVVMEDGVAEDEAVI